MPTSPGGLRPAARRRSDTLTTLATPGIDVWVATASVDGEGAARPHLVPLSLAWIDERVVVALAASSRTARNLAASGSARLAVGPTRDVVLVDAVLEASHAVREAPPDLGERYAAQADWDPRTDPGDYVYLVLAPRRIQAWREADELAGRTLMRDGAWLA